MWKKKHKQSKMPRKDVNWKNKKGRPPLLVNLKKRRNVQLRLPHDRRDPALEDVVEV